MAVITGLILTKKWIYESEFMVMNRYVPLDKRSKKAQKAFHSGQRRTWGAINPVTRSVPNGKAYNRKKEKEKTGREFRDEFDAGLLFC